MSKTYFFLQTFSLPIAYLVTSIYLNINNYIIQLDEIFNNRFPSNFPESWILALIIFLVVFLLPNLYVYLSLQSLKEDLINERIQRDLHITPQEQYIEINAKNYTIKGTLDNQFIGFILVTILSFLINYSSLTLLLLYSITLALISTLYGEGTLIVINPYLRLKYNVYELQGEDKTLYIIIEKEKEFERPRFSDYIIDWYYDHLILVGFKHLTKQPKENHPQQKETVS